jgi:hypothetical protein
MTEISKIKTGSFRSQLHKALSEAIYLFLIFFFCYTAANKLVNLQAFRTNLFKTTLFSEAVVNVLSVTVIVMEIILILILIFRKKTGLLLLSFTMAVFTIYITYLRFMGLYEVCGCGGILNGLAYKYHFYINIALMGGALYSYVILNIRRDEK